MLNVEKNESDINNDALNIYRIIQSSLYLSDPIFIKRFIFVFVIELYISTDINNFKNYSSDETNDYVNCRHF